MSKLAITLSIFAVAARLVLIDQPYIDSWSWRQSDVAAIARNFEKNDFHFAYPQIDWAGDAPGYVGTEFPILPFLAALSYKISGVHEWIGRSQAVIFFAVSLPFFFLLVREIFGGMAATWATFFYSFAPLNIFAGRSFMPDVPSLSLALIGLYFFLRWIDEEQPASFVWAAFAISLALLSSCRLRLLARTFLVWQKWRWNFLRQGSGFLRLTIYLHSPGGTHQIAERFYPHHFSAREDFGSKISRGTGRCATDRDVEPHAHPLSWDDCWFVRGPARETRRSLSLVACCDDSLHHHTGLWQSPSLVSAPARADRSRVCRRSLRIGRSENLCFACCGDYLVNPGCEFVLGSSLRLRATLLPPVGR
jgi:hypothetical protein